MKKLNWVILKQFLIKFIVILIVMGLVLTGFIVMFWN